MGNARVIVRRRLIYFNRLRWLVHHYSNDSTAFPGLACCSFWLLLGVLLFCEQPMQHQPQLPFCLGMRPQGFAFMIRQQPNQLLLSSLFEQHALRITAIHIVGVAQAMNINLISSLRRGHNAKGMWLNVLHKHTRVVLRVRWSTSTHFGGLIETKGLPHFSPHNSLRSPLNWMCQSN